MPQEELYPEEQKRLSDVEAQEDAGAAERSTELANEVPMAEAGLSPSSIDLATRALASVIEKLSDGQVPPPVIPVPDTDVTQAPVPLYVGLKAVSMFGEQQGWPAELLFDPARAVSSSEELDATTEKLHGIAKMPDAGKPKAPAKPEAKAPPAPGEKSAAVAKGKPPAEAPEKAPEKKKEPKPGPGDKAAAMMRGAK